MNAVPSPSGRRGLDLLAAHCAGLDRLLLEHGETPARERLEEAVGPDLAHKLVFALSRTAHGRQRFAA
jgi:hypothetical protein